MKAFDQSKSNNPTEIIHRRGDQQQHLIYKVLIN